MALEPNRLPDVTARTAPSIVISATTPQGVDRVIGAIKSISRTISRDVSRRRELDSNVPGITVELVPGAVTQFSITLDRVMLNKSSMLEAFGIGQVEDLIHQNIPITIKEHRYYMDKGTKKEQVVVYSGCYFTSNPISVDIDSDWMIVQSCDLDVATCTVTDPR